jgi:hypothetical protein
MDSGNGKPNPGGLQRNCPKPFCYVLDTLGLPHIVMQYEYVAVRVVDVLGASFNNGVGDNRSAANGIVFIEEDACQKSEALFMKFADGSRAAETYCGASRGGP